MFTNFTAAVCAQATRAKVQHHRLIRQFFTSENNDIANQNVDTSFFTSEKNRMTNQLASLEQRDYFYLDPFSSVNLGTYIIKTIYYIDTDEIPGFLLLLKNHIFTARSERIIFIFHM